MNNGGGGKDTGYKGVGQWKTAGTTLGTCGCVGVMAVTHDLKYLVKQRCRSIYLALPSYRRNSTGLPNAPIPSCNATFCPVLELLLEASAPWKLCFPFIPLPLNVIVVIWKKKKRKNNQRYIFYGISKLTCKQGTLRPYSLNHIQLVQVQLIQSVG